MIGVFILKPVFVPHATYQDFVLNQLQKHYSGGSLTLLNSDWPIITKHWRTALYQITKTIGDTYVQRNMIPKEPASIMRSNRCLILTNPTMSVTKWVDELNRVPLYAILSGFEPGNIPGIGTFYDFFARLGGVRKRIEPIKQKVKEAVNENPKKARKVEKHQQPQPDASNGWSNGSFQDSIRKTNFRLTVFSISFNLKSDGVRKTGALRGCRTTECCRRRYTCCDGVLHPKQAHL